MLGIICCIYTCSSTAAITSLHSKFICTGELSPTNDNWYAELNRQFPLPIDLNKKLLKLLKLLTHVTYSSGLPTQVKNEDREVWYTIFTTIISTSTFWRHSLAVNHALNLLINFTLSSDVLFSDWHVIKHSYKCLSVYINIIITLFLKCSYLTQ